MSRFAVVRTIHRDSCTRETPLIWTESRNVGDTRPLTTEMDRPELTGLRPKRLNRHYPGDKRGRVMLVARESAEFPSVLSSFPQLDAHVAAV